MSLPTFPLLEKTTFKKKKKLNIKNCMSIMTFSQGKLMSYQIRMFMTYKYLSLQSTLSVIEIQQL